MEQASLLMGASIRYDVRSTHGPSTAGIDKIEAIKKKSNNDKIQHNI
jgi:hypothetical protein